LGAHGLVGFHAQDIEYSENIRRWAFFTIQHDLGKKNEMEKIERVHGVLPLLLFLQFFPIERLPGSGLFWHGMAS
jgi:hypothetical protein